MTAGPSDARSPSRASVASACRRMSYAASAVCVVATLFDGACGGTTGREGLSTPGTDGGANALADATAADAIGDATGAGPGDEGDAGAFDPMIQYADRTLPDVAAPPDAGEGGAGLDASDGGASLAPCTMAGQTNCVQCGGNLADDAGHAAGVCSPTEALFVQFDISKGRVTAPGPERCDAITDVNPTLNATRACYCCLYKSGCIDDTVLSDTGHECGDLPSGNFPAGNGNSDSYGSLCLATIQCVRDTGCALTNGGIDNCYCGPGGGSPAQCPKNGPATNGVCKTQETNGFKFPPDDSTNILKNYDDHAEPSGIANQIFVCGNVNGCTQCFQ
jgi:hypothetical protein